MFVSFDDAIRELAMLYRPVAREPSIQAKHRRAQREDCKGCASSHHTARLSVNPAINIPSAPLTVYNQRLDAPESILQRPRPSKINTQWTVSCHLEVTRAFSDDTRAIRGENETRRGTAVLESKYCPIGLIEI